jgi:hypothetical protein
MRNVGQNSPSGGRRKEEAAAQFHFDSVTTGRDKGAKKASGRCFQHSSAIGV